MDSASRTEMQVRSMRLNLEASILNGDAVANGLRGFDGLARRIRPGDRMAIANGSGALNVDRVDALIDSVNSFGQAKYLLCSKPLRRQLNRAAREATGSGIDRDGGVFGCSSCRDWADSWCTHRAGRAGRHFREVS